MRKLEDYQEKQMKTNTALNACCADCEHFQCEDAPWENYDTGFECAIGYYLDTECSDRLFEKKYCQDFKDTNLSNPKETIPK